MAEKTYLCIDLKSFYASVECVERGLDPMSTNLVVADASRTQKTICLAVSPALKAYGIPGRPRLFEVDREVKRVNAQRKSRAPGRALTGSSYFTKDLLLHPEYAVDYIVAPPRMAFYLEYSTRIYQVYLKYIAPEDIHVYSIDEVFIDLTHYLPARNMNAHDFARMMIQDVMKSTGITATAGIGTNMYLAKIAMDIVAKHISPDDDGVRVAYLDEYEYRRLLWNHRPLTDFWRVGKGYAKKLEDNGLFTMGDVARCSIGRETDYYNEELLYRLFGVGAELLIDHAWGWEPCTIGDVKHYSPASNSIGSGQVLQNPYTAEQTRLVVREMTDLLTLDLVDQRLVTDQMVLTVGYDIENLTDPKRAGSYHGEVSTDAYGRHIPKHAHGTQNLEQYTSSTKQITDAVMALFDRIINPDLLVRRVNLVANHVIPEDQIPAEAEELQMDLFTDYAEQEEQEQAAEDALEKERRMQETMLAIKKKFGKNAILKGMNLQDGATAKQRNSRIGGHKA